MDRAKKKRRAALIVLYGLFVSSIAFAQSTLRVSAIPDEAPTELQRKFAPLGMYLENETVSNWLRARLVR